MGGLFADVVFGGATLASSDYAGVLAPVSGPEIVQWLPERPGRAFYHGWYDIGAGAWQLAPTIHVMARALRDGESVSWDPYRGAGSVGPESMTGLHFTPLVLASAALDSAYAWDLCLLLLLTAAAASLLRITSRRLRLPLPAAVLVVLVFLQNGFASANTGIQTSIPYFMGPPVLWSYLRFAERPETGRGVVAALACALLLTATFLPTLACTLLFVNLLTLGYAFEHTRPVRVALGLAALQAAALACVGFLYGPILAHLSLSSHLGSYLAQETHALPPESFLSLITPKHFWESYNAYAHSMAAYGDPPPSPDRYVFWASHTGVIAALLAACAFAGSRGRRGAVRGCLCAAVGIAALRILGVPGTRALFAAPPLSAVSHSYWFTLSMPAVALLAGFGLAGLARGSKPAPASWILLGAIGAGVAFLHARLGLPAVGDARFHLAILGAVCSVAAALLLTLGITARTGIRAAAVWGLVALAAAEGVFYTNHVRLARRDMRHGLPAPIAWLREASAGAGGPRILNATRSALPPNWGSALALPQVGSADYGALPDYERFFRRYLGADHRRFLTFSDTAPGAGALEPEALDLLGVRWVVTSGGLLGERLRRAGYVERSRDSWRIVLENPRALARAFLVPRLFQSGAAPVGDALSPERAATTRDPRLLETARRLGIPAGEAGAPDTESFARRNRADIASYANTRVEIEVRNADPAVLVVSDSWHPGWRATRDGEPAHLARVDMAFRGVALGPGSHRVVLDYDPPVLARSRAVSLAGALLLAGVGVGSRVRAARGRGAARPRDRAASTRRREGGPRS